MNYRKKFDEVMIGRVRLSNNEFGKEDKMRIVEHGLPKKMCDSGNFVLPVRVNGTVQMSALADTGASISVLPYSLYKSLGLIQIGYQAYLVDFLVLDIPVDKELILLLGRLFLRTCGVVIDIGRGTISIDDGVIRHTYFPKPRAKAYLVNFEIDEEDGWLSCFKVGRDEDGNPKCGPVAPSFLDIENEMERALAMEAYFNPFKNIIKIEGDGSWHTKFEVITPSGRKFSRGLRQRRPRGSSPESLLRRIFSSSIISLTRSSSIQDKSQMKNEEIKAQTMCLDKATHSLHPNPLIAKYERRNSKGTINYTLQQVTNANLKWRDLPSMDRHAYCESFDETLKELMKMEYLHSDGDVFVDYSWERALSIEGDVLCGREHVLTLSGFALLLGLYEESELEHRLFGVHFSKLEIDDKLFDHNAYWRKMMSALKESRGVNLAWVIAEHLCKHAPGLKENSLICRGHYVTKIAKPLGIERRDVWRDSMLMRNNYMLEHSMPILHHLADQSNFAYPTYEPPNVPPYPYPYVPYPHPYTHYPDMGNQSHGGGHYGAPSDGYFEGSIPSLGGTSIVPSSGYEVGGSSGGVRDEDDDDMSDQFILRYVKGTLNYGLNYVERQEVKHLVGFSNSDHAGDMVGARSTSGMIFYLGRNAITWQSQKQQIISLSSCEYKFIAATAAAC
ncbi:retrovirus-related pol polyprotein from transposon TNT 1-94 [Tanacetum coccineum]